MSQIFARIDDAARVLGYLSLTVWVIFIIWLAAKLTQEVRFDWRQKRKKELELDNLQSSWLLDELKHGERNAVDHDRHNTDVLDLGGLLQHHQGEDVPETRPYEAVYDYQEDLTRERPQRNQGRGKVRRR